MRLGFCKEAITSVVIFHYFANCFLIAMWTLKSVFKLISDSSYVYLIECSYMFKGGEIFCRCRLSLHKSFYFSVITHFLVIAAHKFFLVLVLVLVLKHGHVLWQAVFQSKRSGRRAQAGFPLLFVCMVALVSIMLGYLCHSWIRTTSMKRSHKQRRPQKICK